MRYEWLRRFYSYLIPHTSYLIPHTSLLFLETDQPIGVDAIDIPLHVSLPTHDQLIHLLVGEAEIRDQSLAMGG